MATHESPERPLAGVHVLVVDDHPDSPALLAPFLELAGARVTLAPTPEAALETVEGQKPDVVITDVVMGGRDGRWLLHQLRRRAPGVLVVAVTAAAMDDPADAFDAAYLRPVDPWRLCVEVAGLLRRRRTR